MREKIHLWSFLPDRTRRRSQSPLVLVTILLLMGTNLVTIGCDSRSDQKSEEVRATQAEQQAALERQQREAAERARDQANAKAERERAIADRNYAVAVAACFAGLVMLLVGGVIGIAMGSKARDASLAADGIDGRIPTLQPAATLDQSSNSGDMPNTTPDEVGHAG